MNSLIVLTTATPRPDLHKAGLFEVIKTLIEGKTQNKIFWYVNVDRPSMFSKQEVEQTLKQINDFAREKTNELSVTTLSDHEVAHAGAAARRLYETIGKSQPFNKDTEVFFWLEDDWALTDSETFVREVKNFFKTNQDVLLCTSQKYISGHPFLFKRDFFDVIIDKYKTVKKNPDPELMLFDCVKEYYMTEEKRLKQPSQKRKEVFKDIGREWRIEQSIGKMNKYKAKRHSFTWFKE